MADEWIRTPCDTGSCVEVKRSDRGVQLRAEVDARMGWPGVLMTADEWAQFLAAVKAGHFDAV